MLSRFAKPVLRRQSLTANELTLKCFSSYYGGGEAAKQNLRAYPQYTVYGENCMLALKLIPPTFQISKTSILFAEKKGRLLLEWISRSTDGSLDFERSLKFALSPEEVGLIIDQLPEHQVELARQPSPSSGDFTAVTQSTSGQKVITLSPRNGGVVAFKIHDESGGSAPQEVLVQLGEFRVMHELMKSSIPVLSGWQVQVDLSLERALDNARRGREAPSSSKAASLNDIPF
jgi:hypothetical protein